jgi:hypothetical protein
MAASLLAIVYPWAGLSDLAPALAALTDLNMTLLRRRPLPLLYDSGVRYEREKPFDDGTPREQWLTAPVVLMRHAGDCEDLACWRSAELQLQGIDAKAQARRSSVGYHIVVVYANGTIEDPSRKLGM